MVVLERKSLLWPGACCAVLHPRSFRRSFTSRVLDIHRAITQNFKQFGKGNECLWTVSQASNSSGSVSLSSKVYNG